MSLWTAVRGVLEKGNYDTLRLAYRNQPHQHLRDPSSKDHNPNNTRPRIFLARFHRKGFARPGRSHLCLVSVVRFPRAKAAYTHHLSIGAKPTQHLTAKVLTPAHRKKLRIRTIQEYSLDRWLRSRRQTTQRHRRDGSTAEGGAGCGGGGRGRNIFCTEVTR